MSDTIKKSHWFKYDQKPGGRQALREREMRKRERARERLAALDEPKTPGKKKTSGTVEAG